MNKIASTQFLFLLIGFLLLNQTSAQKQNNQWMFGYGGGIDFNFCPPVGVDGGLIATTEGVASIANRRTGDILFYTNGVTIWDKNNTPMPNARNLTGGSAELSSTTAATIIPAVNDTNLYYIVTIDEQFSNQGLRYSVLDMRLNGGLGDIVSGQKNILLFNTNSEKVQVVPNSAKNGYWIISHNNSESFVVFSLTSAGINTTPIISNAGGSQSNGAGHIKVNRQFNKIALSVISGGEINLLDFDNSTGIIKDNLTFKHKLANPLIYGLEFSLDGTKLYASNLEKIAQYDISLNTGLAISNSLYDVLLGGNFSNQPATLQMGPNNKIYVNVGGSIGCINSPNLQGALCDYENNAIKGLTGGGGYGLPQFVYSLTDDGSNSNITNAILSKDSCVNNAIQFSLFDSISVISVQWNFGDNLISSSNTSTLKSPLYTYRNAGNYDVKALIKTECGEIEVLKKITIIDCSSKNCKVSINTLDSCSQKLVQFSVKADSAIKSVNWFFGDDNAGLDNSSNSLNPSYTYGSVGKYTIQLIAELSCGIDTVFKEIEIVDCTVDTTIIQTFLPNVFTPNSDFINDTFKISSNKKLEQFNLIIYNRWGQEVFSSNNYEQGWDGNYQNNNCAEGVYFYLISYTYNKNIFSNRGTVTLLK